MYVKMNRVYKADAYDHTVNVRVPRALVILAHERGIIVSKVMRESFVIFMKKVQSMKKIKRVKKRA